MSNLFRNLLLLSLFLLPEITPAQKVTSGGTKLKWPWTGGMNACQFCEIDLNMDSKRDLLVFDRHGNRLLPMLRTHNGTADEFSYRPEFARLFPEMQEWVMTADYNLDGKMDLFTYRNGGIMVYRNQSDSLLSFDLVTNMLNSFYYTGKVGILVTSVDYPAITDLDGDGDLDILTFFGLGSFVEFHKNLSMEWYGYADSLEFRLEDRCWGKFSESETGNRITLNAVCPLDGFADQPHKERHTGSTMLVTDLNHDQLPDLILGDYDYPSVTVLFNGGTPSGALMVAIDTLFPASEPIQVFSFPSIVLTDINGDGKKDLLAAPFDPSTETSENDHCAWYYENTGSDEWPVFQLKTRSFLREEMLDFGSGSAPLLADLDQDGLTDLLVGNEGYYDSSWYEYGYLKSSFISKIAYYRNTGSAEKPHFTFVTDDLAGASVLKTRGLFPAVSDLDLDGIPDLIAGCQDGTLLFFKGINPSGAIPAFAPPVKNWQQIDVGHYSSPCLFDLDLDQLPDLIIGERNGNLNYYRNTGSAGNPSFTLVTDSLGKVNVTNPNLSWYGYSTPCLFTGQDMAINLLTGSDDGAIHLYPDIGNNLPGTFQRADTLWRWIQPSESDSLSGRRSSPAVAHLSSSGRFDLIAGNFSGGLNFFSLHDAPAVTPGITPFSTLSHPTFSFGPNPANDRITIRLPSDNNNNVTRMNIRDLYGRLMMTSMIRGQSIVSISHLPAGFYLLEAGSTAKKLIIQRPD